MSKSLYVINKDFIIDLDEIILIGDDCIRFKGSIEASPITKYHKKEIIQQLIKRKKIINPEKYITDSLVDESKIEKESIFDEPKAKEIIEEEEFKPNGMYSDFITRVQGLQK
jgi:hypothetical protein|tara:strand:- start:1660 stop:1995 length:336 start_codon:yes stop_codon:yes gene_type:complete